MTVLEREYRFLIARALRQNDRKLARELRDWGRIQYRLDLTDIEI